MAFLYKITNTTNSKCYIGWTSKPINKRWEQHKKAALSNIDNRKFYNAIRKYGIDVWQIELLCETSSIEEAKLKEIELIEFFDSFNIGYKSTKGGDGNNGIVMSESSNLARSNKLKGRKKSPETVAKFKERRSTPEENKKRSIAHTGMKKPWVKWTNDQITKRAMTRRSLSKEQYDEMHLLRSQGFTIKKIGELVGCSSDLVKKWLKKSWELTQEGT